MIVIRFILIDFMDYLYTLYVCYMLNKYKKNCIYYNDLIKGAYEFWIRFRQWLESVGSKWLKSLS